MDEPDTSNVLDTEGTDEGGDEECFVMSPFGGWFDTYYKEVYRPAVEKAGLNPRRADDMYRPSAIVSDIWSLIRRSTVMLADLTDRNPNVFYELGLAHALGKPVVLTTQSIADVPFDLRALRVLEYNCLDPAWAEKLREAVAAALLEVKEEPADAVLAPFLRHADVAHQPSVSADEARLMTIENQVAGLTATLRSAFPERPWQAGGAVWEDPRTEVPAEAIALLARRLTESGYTIEDVNRQIEKDAIRRRLSRGRESDVSDAAEYDNEATTP